MRKVRYYLLERIEDNTIPGASKNRIGKHFIGTGWGFYSDYTSVFLTDEDASIYGEGAVWSGPTKNLENKYTIIDKEYKPSIYQKLRMSV
jgi:hypothetical protein